MRLARYNHLVNALAPPGSPAHARLRQAVIAVTVAIVLADSSVVILALPDILTRFDVEVAQVAWVLTAYNLVLALLAIPAAMISRRAPGAIWAVGAVVFGGASVACALAGSLEVLIAARCVQAVGGAFLVAGARPLLDTLTPRAGRMWAVAGVAGLAVGPAVGGALTQLISWQSIFVVQVPVMLVGAAALGLRTRRETGTPGRPHVLANLSLVLISAGLTAALFLVVLLMINGWGMRPLAAAVGVTLMPIAAILSARIAGHVGSDWARAMAGAVGVGGGLVALGLMPGASVWWTALPQLLIGLGLGLAIPALTDAALTEGRDQVVHAGWTIAARHLGVVLGILLLTPIFVADLDRQQDRALNAVTGIVLDSSIAPETKIALAREGEAVIAAADGRVPDVAPAFDAVTPREDDRSAFRDLQAVVTDRVARAATASVTRSFLAAAALALLALLPLGRARLGVRPR